MNRAGLRRAPCDSPSLRLNYLLEQLTCRPIQVFRMINRPYVCQQFCINITFINIMHQHNVTEYYLEASNLDDHMTLPQHTVSSMAVVSQYRHYEHYIPVRWNVFVQRLLFKTPLSDKQRQYYI